MKYAKINNGVVCEPVFIPDSIPYGATPERFIEIMFGSSEGFKEVPDDTESGATDNGDGTYSNPMVPAPNDPAKPTKAELISKIEELLAAVQALQE